MARSFQFDVDDVVEKLNRILQMELAAVIYYTHYSFMIYGHARIPITSWLRDNATESLAHAQEAVQMIMRLHKRPALGIAALPTTHHNTIDEILTESIEREEAGVELYRELLALVKDKSVVLEEYAMRLVSAEAVHLREMEVMLMTRAHPSRVESHGSRIPAAQPVQRAQPPRLLAKAFVSSCVNQKIFAPRCRRWRLITQLAQKSSANVRCPPKNEPALAGLEGA